ncbi:MAG TPA: dihydroorotate dehydrogenase catalytic subunit, partial [Firmicutes bacterium]|nr:dihydroorotate dehydrogenase catalytic subunit [Bacillota bacterium]
VKATTLYPRLGNPTPRVTEVTGGMLNAIGLANPGLDEVLAEELPWLAGQNVPIFVNVAGDTVEDYCEVVEQVSRSGLAQAVELNVSCPNVKLGGLAFGVDATVLRGLVEEVRKVCTLPLFVKLSPNVTRVQDL